jgi:hypothetical protein
VVVTLTSSDPSQGTPSIGSLTFDSSNWSTPVPVTVTGQDDHIVLGDISYTIQLSASSTDSHYDGQSSSVALTNLQRDVASLQITPTTGLVTDQAGGTAQFTVALTSAPLDPVVVALTSSDPSQGTASVGSLTFDSTNWSMPISVTVTGQDDHIVQGDVPYTIQLSATSTDSHYNGQSGSVALTNLQRDVAALSISPTSGLVTDQAGATAQFTVALTSAPLDPVVVSLTSSDSGHGTPSVSSLTFDAGNWSTPVTVTVTGQDDHIVQGDVPYTIQLSASSTDSHYDGQSGNVALTNLQRDVAALSISPTAGLVTDQAGATAQFTVALTSAPLDPVVVALTSSDPSQGTPSAGNLTFNSSNWSTPIAVTVTGQNDHIVQGDVPYTIQVSASSTDGHYDGQASRVALTNLQRDLASLLVTPSSGLQTSEAGDTAQFTVALSSQPLNPVLVSLTSSDPTQGTPSLDALTFDATNWDLPVTVKVTGHDDQVAHGDQSYQIDLSAASLDGHYGSSIASVSLTNQERDVAGISIIPSSGLMTQAGMPTQFALALTSKPTQPVVITLASSDPEAGTLSTSRLVFTPADWNVSQSVAVTGGDGHAGAGDVSYSILISPAVSADSSYNGLRVADLVVVNHVAPSSPILPPSPSNDLPQPTVKAEVHEAHQEVFTGTPYIASGVSLGGGTEAATPSSTTFVIADTDRARPSAATGLDLRLFGAAQPRPAEDDFGAGTEGNAEPPIGVVTHSASGVVVRLPRVTGVDSGSAAPDTSGDSTASEDTATGLPPAPAFSGWSRQAALFWQELDAFREQVDTEAWSLLTDPAVVTTVTVSVGYVIMNVRNLYFLASVLVTMPLWRRFDPLAVLDVWDDQRRARPAGRTEEKDDEEQLQPILG